MAWYSNKFGMKYPLLLYFLGTKIVEVCLFGFSYFAHYGIAKSFVVGQTLGRFGDLEHMVPALTPSDIMADIMINLGSI